MLVCIINSYINFQLHYIKVEMAARVKRKAMVVSDLVIQYKYLYGLYKFLLFFKMANKKPT